MDSKKIEELLTKYWNCETSLEEEEQLRAYFRWNNVPKQFQEAASLFRYFEASKKKSLNDESFDETLIGKVNKPAKAKMIRLLYNSMRIAAGIAVLVMAVWFVRKELRGPVQDQAVVDTYDDPKMAFEETKKALMMISKSFGQAEKQAQKIKIFNDAQQEIQRDKKTKK